MPSAPARTCVCPGCPACDGRCPNLTASRRCDPCTATKHRRYDQQDRNQERKAIYRNPRWRAVRNMVRREQPWCNVAGCTQLSAEVDHVVPLRTILEAGGDPYDRTNLQGLCRFHHSQKTNAEVYDRK